MPNTDKTRRSHTAKHGLRLQTKPFDPPPAPPRLDLARHFLDYFAAREVKKHHEALVLQCLQEGHTGVVANPNRPGRGWVLELDSDSPTGFYFSDTDIHSL